MRNKFQGGLCIKNQQDRQRLVSKFALSIIVINGDMVRWLLWFYGYFGYFGYFGYYC
jgi:hypothetical protein